jgi:hypothetical protein
MPLEEHTKKSDCRAIKRHLAGRFADLEADLRTLSVESPTRRGGERLMRLSKAIGAMQGLALQALKEESQERSPDDAGTEPEGGGVDPHR